MAVIINSLKVPKIKKILLYKNFLYQITAASRTPDNGATAPRSLSSVLKRICWNLPTDNIPGYATTRGLVFSIFE